MFTLSWNLSPLAYPLALIQTTDSEILFPSGSKA